MPGAGQCAGFPRTAGGMAVAPAGPGSAWGETAPSSFRFTADHAASSGAMNDIETALWMHVATVLPLVVFKICVLVVGYLIARLGYQLLMHGVKGEFQFHTQFRESVVDLISVSPGIFFIFMATVMIAIGIFVEKPFETSFSSQVTELADDARGTAFEAQREVRRPELPPLPPHPEDFSE